jgi:hypothetical protein
LGLDLLAEELELDDAPAPADDDSQERIESVRLIKEAASTAVDILNNLLQYDKLHDNTLVVSKSTLHALDFVAEVLEPFKIQVV